MNLSELARATGVDLDDGRAVTRVTEDSRRVVPGAAFFALQGSRADGLDFAAAAAAAGAVAIVAATPRPEAIAPEVAWLVVSQPRAALARAAAAFFGEPARALRLTGVTGSKGKTTTAFLIAAAAEATGSRAALLTTVLCRSGGGEHPATLTTSSAPVLHEHLAEAVAAGDDAAVIEVSSHALDQDRVHGLAFAFGVFTNLFPDHLDYHRDMADYFAAKRRLLVGPDAAGAVALHIADEHGRRLAGERADAVTFGAVDDAAVRPITASADRHGLHLRAATPGGEVELRSPLLGRHNVPNLLAALAWAVAAEVDVEAAAAGAAAMPAVPGRLEPIAGPQPFQCLVDFAHTGPALGAVLGAVREWTSGRVVAVFGAGGERDVERRRGMGEVAADLADACVITTDNPRGEDPLAIVRDIEKAYDAAGGRDRRSVPDRTEAVALAIAGASAGDCVVIAGRGHEREQILATGRIPLDDRQLARDALAAAGFAA